MKNVALTNCWCGFADGWDKVIKRKDCLTLIIAVRKCGYKRNLLIVAIKVNMVV